MLERLMALSLRNRLVVGLAVLVILCLGAYAVRTIPIDAFPDVTNIQVEVVSTAAGMSPLEIEQFVTLPARERDARPARAGHDAVGDQVRPVGRDARVSRRRGHLLREAAGPRAGVRDRAEPARRRGYRDGPHRHRDGRDLPVHAPERRPEPGRPRCRRTHQAPDDPGLDGDAAAQGRDRRHRDQLVRRVSPAVPGPGGPGQTAEVRPLGRCGGRGGSQQQLERRRQRRLLRVRTAHHPRRGPDPVGGRHPQDRPQGRAGHAGHDSRRGRGPDRSRDPAGRRPDERPAGGGGRHRDDAARREQPQRGRERRRQGPRDQREPRAAGRASDRPVLRTLVDRQREHQRRS